MKKFLTTVCFIVTAMPLLQSAVLGQQKDGISSEKIVEKTINSVALILTGRGSGILDGVGSGVVIRSDGVILTAYHVVKDASQVQVRLKNGEIYDKVQLLGFDERRDVAALKIAASNLSAATIDTAEPQIGSKVYVISNPQSLSWTVADGLLSAVRMADDVPGAGRGFRVLQFSAPVSAGSSGGLLADETGQALGLIVSTLSTGQNLNFAVPLASVSGLADSPVTSSFGRGNDLELPQAVRPPSTTDLANADPKTILKNAKFLYIYTGSDLINEQMMENALMKIPEFEKWKLVIVKNQKLADIDINVEHDLFTWNYRYSVTDHRTNILLASGKVTAWDGRVASGKFAKMIIDKLRPGREPAREPEKKAEKKKNT